ncbi:MAG: hypothetical protein EBZ48_03300 [Proteobacteria bacterium]|nr:hypothetical protein [Pseudomonadota bacterium]
MASAFAVLSPYEFGGLSPAFFLITLNGMHYLLADIGLSIILAAAFGVIFFKLKQPSVLGYFVAGALLGPGVGFGLVSEPENIEVISEIGLILLLFVIGLEMNLSELASAGKQLAVAGLGQFVVCVGLGLAVFSVVPVPGVTGQMGVLYASLLCALSSTAIVVKLLYDKFELDSRAGRLTIGILVIQDLWAILVLAFQPNFASPEISLIGTALLKSVMLVMLGYVVSKFILGPIFERISKSPEVVMLMSLGWCAAMAATAQYLGLSKEMGALIAGAAVSAFPYRIHVIAKTLPLRDFFITLFFVSLGMKIVAPERAMIEGALIITAFVVLSRFLSVYPLLRISGGGYRSAFLTSVNLAQVSEFSLVIASLGVGFGHISADFMAMIIYAMGISAVLSSYLIKYNSQLYTLLFAKHTARGSVAESAVVHAEGVANVGLRDVFILGYHHCGRALIQSLQSSTPQLLNRIKVIDFNLEALRELESLPVKAVFADLSSLDTLEHLHLDRARVILLTLPDLLLKGTSSQQVVGICRAVAPHAVIIGMADSAQHRAALISSGANDAILWYHTKADSLAALIKDVDAGESAPGEAAVLE